MMIPRSLREQLAVMTPAQRKVLYGGAVFIAILIAYVIVGTFGGLSLHLPFFSERATREAQLKKTSPRGAFEIALPAAKHWKSDAELSFLASDSAGILGRADDWRLIFIAKSAKGRGYAIVIWQNKISEMTEIPYVGTAAEFPENIISQEEAIERVHMIHGYERAQILGIEAIYGPAEKAWYWGVKTPQGVVSVEAKRK